MSRLIPADWLVRANPRRCILHWTGGGSEASEADKLHYHVLIDRKGKPIRGEHAISDNDWTGDDDYAAHTRGANTASIGVALCGMLGAVEKPFSAGKYPLTKTQWNAALLVCAQLCERYGIVPDRKHLLMHSEVERFLGQEQRGKWDIEARTWAGPEEFEMMTPGEELRLRVKRLLEAKR